MHRPDLTDWADAHFLAQGPFLKRKTFGCPSYYLGKKMVAFVHEDSLVIKLTLERADELAASDGETYGYFDPMDRGSRMNGWLTITFPEATEYERIVPLIEEAIASVAREPMR